MSCPECELYKAKLGEAEKAIEQKIGWINEMGEMENKLRAILNTWDDSDGWITDKLDEVMEWAIKDLTQRAEQAEAKLAASEARGKGMEQDAKRYRWLRKERPRLQDGQPFIATRHVGGYGYSGWTEEHADKQIDACLAPADKEG